MTKNHLKRLASSDLIRIKKKGIKYMMRPNPGAHKLLEGVSLGIVLRDLLKKVKTMKEAKRVLYEKNVLVDGKKRKDPAFVVGLMDLICLKEIKESFRVVLDKKGKLIVIEIDEKENNLKLEKITGKNMNKGKTEVHLIDGKTIITKEKSYKVGDSLLIELPSQNIKQHIKFEVGNIVYVIGGKSAGKIGVLKEIKGKKIIFDVNGISNETIKDYAMIIGEKKPVLTLEKEAKK